MKNLNRTTNHGPRATQSKATRSLRLFLTLCVVLGAWNASAYSASYDIKQMTPEVREALAGRQQRYSEVQAAKRAGAARETDQGYIECRTNQSLCGAENHDRQVIYRTIAEQNDLGGAGLSQIQRAFAETIREREGR